MKITTSLFLGIICLTLLVVAASGCRSLPTDFEVPEPSYAFPPVAEGPLAEFANACEKRVEHGESSFYLLHLNDETLRWRLALVDSAKTSLDLQTFQWASDFSGRLFISRMKQAADRGVRVRLLVDDFKFRNRDRAVAALNDHPNIEIRIWNPGRRRQVGRNLDFLVRLSELNHRLHNKVLIADNRVLIAGGRNIADEYYGLSERFNFFDLDLLSVGPVVLSVSDMFDLYWNSSQAVPASIFHRRGSKEDLPDLMARYRRTMLASPSHEVFPLDPQTWEDLLAVSTSAMIPGEAEVIYDKPGESAPTQHAMIGLKKFFRQAKEEVRITSPYLVPGEIFFEEAQELNARNVNISVMTNSLGSTNQPIVHDAYSRTRRPMLRTGVKVYEMRYEAAMKSELDTPPVQSRWVGLHAKAAVLDRQYVFIGSYNITPRSRNLNTEILLLVHSKKLGEQLASVLEQAMAPENSWRLRLGDDEQIYWESSDGKLTRQPAQTVWRRVQSGIFGLFPLEEHL